MRGEWHNAMAEWLEIVDFALQELPDEHFLTCWLGEKEVQIQRTGRTFFLTVLLRLQPQRYIWLSADKAIESLRFERMEGVEGEHYLTEVFTSRDLVKRERVYIAT